MKFRQRTITALANMVCGNAGPGDFFKYRSSFWLTTFFSECGTNHKHGNASRTPWVAGVLEEILQEPSKNAQTPPSTFARVIQNLMDPEDATDEGYDRPKALAALNLALAREGLEAFYGTDKKCHVRHIGGNAVDEIDPHRPFSAAELERRVKLSAYMDHCSEDDLIGEVLLPLFRQLGFQRITAAGHKDKALEYGKDVWMKYALPTTHGLYFGIQVKKGKLDAAGMTKDRNANIAEIHNQVLMMLGHEIFDPETGRTGLVDHAYIVAGGEITKQARNWLGQKLDAAKRSQIMFMDREDILNLYTVTNLPIPGNAPLPPKALLDDDIPF